MLISQALAAPLRLVTVDVVLTQYSDTVLLIWTSIIWRRIPLAGTLILASTI